MTAGPFSVPVAPPAPPAAPSSRAVQRIGLAFALWLIWCAPLVIIATTAPRFVELFKEFGVKLTGAQLAMAQTGNMLGSPLGWGLMLVALPALCMAVSALILPPRVAMAGPERARWPLVIIAVVGSLGGAVALWIAYSVLMATTMMPIIDKLNQKPVPAATTAPAPAAR